MILEEGVLETSGAFKRIEYTLGGRDGECWVNVSHCKDSAGYAYVCRNGKTQKMHRYVYELFNGKIKDGNHILHSCDNPSCINPKHLSEGTNKENVRQKMERGRHRVGDHSGEKNPSSKLTVEQVKEIKLLLKQGELNQTEVSKKFGIKQTTVSQINTGKIWKEVEI